MKEYTEIQNNELSKGLYCLIKERMKNYVILKPIMNNMTPSLMIQTAAQLCPILDGATPKIYQYKIYVTLSLLILLDCLSW